MSRRFANYDKVSRTTTIYLVPIYRVVANDQFDCEAWPPYTANEPFIYGIDVTIGY